MLRELILFKTDLNEMPWAATGTFEPPHGGANIKFESLDDKLCDRLFEVDSQRDTYRTRLAQGETCIVGIESDSGRCVSSLWLTEHPVFIDWISCCVAPLPHHFLIYNAWVHEDMRGKAVHWHSAAKACEYAVTQGKPRICAGVELKEFAPFARKYAETGLALIEPYASLWTMTLFGKALSWRRPARSDLLGYTQDLRTKYGPEAIR